MEIIKDKSPTIWVIGFPKSGNTWISYLCSYCFNLPFVNFGDPKSTPYNEKIKEITSGSNSWESLNEYSSIQKTHKMPENVPYRNGLVIYVLRDPRDVYVSYDFFMKTKNARFKGRVKYYFISFFGRKNKIKWFLSNWNRHLKAWENRTNVLINYDQLLNDGAQYLFSRLNSSSVKVSEKIIEDAINFFKFENMSGGRKPGEEIQSNFFRKGISGDWKNHLMEKDAILFRSSVKLYKEFVN
jgi:hypothetical protein